MNFQQPIKVEIYKDGYTVEDFTVGVTYYIDVEYRFWGIKDISMYLSETSRIITQQTNNQDFSEQAIAFSVDWSRVNNIDWVAGSSYNPSGATIYLNADNSVDYAKSELELTFLSKF